LALVIIIDHSLTFRRTLAAVYRLIAAVASIFPAKPPRTRSPAILNPIESDLPSIDSSASIVIRW